MKKVRWIALVIVVVCLTAGVTGCMTPVYETAAVKPGTHTSAGIATGYCRGSFRLYPPLQPYPEPIYLNVKVFGLRGDLGLYYGLTNWLETSIRVGLGAGVVFEEEEYVQDRYRSAFPMIDGALGLKIAVPFDYVHPALKLELTPYGVQPAFSTAALLGFGINKETEFLTIGLRRYFTPESEIVDWFSTDLVLGLHCKKGFSLSFGANIGTIIWLDDPNDYGFSLFPPLFTVSLGFRSKD